MFYKNVIKDTCQLSSQKQPLMSVVFPNTPHLSAHAMEKKTHTHTHSSEFMIPTRTSTCPIPCLESSPTPSHMLMSCMKIVSKQTYLFYLRATFQYKYVGQSSKVNLLAILRNNSWVSLTLIIGQFTNTILRTTFQ